jgi:nuclear protein localization family protein 4
VVEEQSIEQVMRSLNTLGAPDVQPSRQGVSDGDTQRRLELAKWLSDWHLLAFLGTCGLLSEVT